MHLVEISQRVVFTASVADGSDWSEIGIHGIDAFKNDDLGRSPAASAVIQDVSVVAADFFMVQISQLAVPSSTRG